MKNLKRCFACQSEMRREMEVCPECREKQPATSKPFLLSFQVLALLVWWISTERKRMNIPSPNEQILDVHKADKASVTARSVHFGFRCGSECVAGMLISLNNQARA
jgi:hypothetical protein